MGRRPRHRPLGQGHENGLRLAGETRANVEVVRLFAVLHDSRRVSEDTDPDHGPRAAEFAIDAYGAGCSTCPTTSSGCCTGPAPGTRTSGPTPTSTVQTCWDADRLDLGRVGITPDPRYLGTEVGQETGDDQMGRRPGGLPGHPGVRPGGVGHRPRGGSLIRLGQPDALTTDHHPPGRPHSPGVTISTELPAGSRK